MQCQLGGLWFRPMDKKCSIFLLFLGLGSLLILLLLPLFLATAVMECVSVTDGFRATCSFEVEGASSVSI